MALSKILENSITDGVISAAKLKDFAAAVDLNGVELILDADQDTSITADTDDQIDIKISGADDFRFTANTFTALAGSGIVVPDGGLTFGSTAISATAAEINLIDGGTSTGTTAVADADGIITNDGGTMRLTTAATFKTYFQEGISTAYDDLTTGDAAVNIATSAGNITIDAQGNDTDIIFKGTDGGADKTFMTIDGSAGGDLFLTGGLIDLKNDGSAVSQIKFYCESSNAHAQTLIGAPHSESATNTLTLPSTGGNSYLVTAASTATLTNKTLTSPKINEDVAVTATATEINLIDGGATVGTTAIADGDGLLINDAGTMRVSTVQTLAAYLDDEITAMPNLTSVGTLTALTVDDVAIDGKVITMTGSSGDTFVTTVAANGATSLVTTDAGGAAANLQITADGTVDIDSAGVLTLDSGAAINIEPAAGSAILLDGTISIDAGVVTGATSITSTAFVGNITGTVATATQNSITTATGLVSVGALDSGTITSGFGAIDTGSSNITTTGVGAFGSLDISGNIDVDGTTNLDVVDIDGAVDIAAAVTQSGGVFTQDGGAVFNEGSADVDFRIESNTYTHAFMLQGSDGFVGLGINAPLDLLHLRGGGANDSAGAPIVRIQKLSGGAVDDGQTIGGMSFGVNDDGVDSGAYKERAKIIAESQNSSSGTRLEFWTGNSNAAIAEQMRIQADGAVIVNNGITLGNGLTYAAANLLDDYEEGVHEATFAMTTSGTCTWNRDKLAYTKVGRLVTLTGEVTCAAISSPAGSMTMSLPFAILSNASDREFHFGFQPVSYHVPLHSDGTFPVVTASAGASIVSFLYATDDGAHADYVPVVGETFFISFSYTAS